MHVCIVLADRPRGSCKHAFFKPGLRLKKLKMPPVHSRVDSEPVYVMYRWSHRPAPRPLNPATSHNNNKNNNNGGLHACVHAAEDMEPIRVTRQNTLLLCHYAEWKSMIVFLLCSVSPSTVCLYTAHKLYAHAPSLLLHFQSNSTPRPGIWTKACWVVYNRSVWMQIYLKRRSGRRRKIIVLVRVFMDLATHMKVKWV